MGTWIDFRKLRSEVSFADVLRHYSVEIKAKGDQHHGFCPLPNHQGQKNSESFSANLSKGIFQCFGCGAKGNLIDFAVLMEKLDPNCGPDVRKAALILQEKFGPNQAKPERAPAPSRRPAKAEPPQRDLPSAAPEPTKQVIVNAPLDFELKQLDPDHPYLDKRGFSKETVTLFGLGYCAKGLLEGRFAIPLHNREGQLVGYAGRTVDDARIGKENPKYRFPSGRERDGVTHEFQKSLILYNAHRIKAPVKKLALVEGFPSVWWLTQMGFPYVVALMGWSMSDEQAAILRSLVQPNGRVWLVSDGDEAGERCAREVLPRVARDRFIRWLKLDEGKQPTDYPGGWFRDKVGK
jgi:DNA primase